MTKKRPNWDLVGRGIERAWDRYDDYECCQDCGKLIDWSLKPGEGDDIVQPGYVTMSGDVFCRRCGREYDRRDEHEFDDEAEGWKIAMFEEYTGDSAYPDPDGEYEICPICGAEKSEWEDCWQIGCEDGWITDLYEQDPLWYDEDDVEMCDVCNGKGGWWVCPNLPHPEAGTLQASAEGGEG